MPTEADGCGRPPVLPAQPTSGGQNPNNPTLSFDGSAAIKAYDNFFYFAFGDRSKILTLRPGKENLRLQCISEKDCNDASDKICCAKIQLKDSKSGSGLSINRCVSKEHDNGKVL